MKPVMSMFSSAATLEKRKRGNALISFTSRPTKKYPFATPIRPCSVVLWKKRPRGYRGKSVGQKFWIGYYCWQDGLDCVWLVNENGKSEQTIDHDFLKRHFEIVKISKERILYGKGRPPIELARESLLPSKGKLKTGMLS